MSNKATALLIAAIAPSLANAQDSAAYQCSYGDLVRRVEIVTEPGVSVPCEVHYYKDTEAPGERQVLWSASSDAAYCEQKTSEFIGKLLGWGWKCGQVDSSISTPETPDEDPAAEPETLPAPDTDFLEPADEAEPGDHSSP